MTLMLSHQLQKKLVADGTSFVIYDLEQIHAISLKKKWEGQKIGHNNLPFDL